MPPTLTQNAKGFFTPWLAKTEGRWSFPSLKTLVDRIPRSSVVVASERSITRTGIEHACAGLDEHLDGHTRQPLIERYPLAPLVESF